jgi:large subunit ribosomal protein L32
MAVQKSKKSKAKRDTRRSHHALKPMSLRVDKLSGEPHISHHITSDGFYKGTLVVQRKVKKQKEETDTEQGG